jgi:hypothetical protein
VQGEFGGERKGQRSSSDHHTVDAQGAFGFGLSGPHGDEVLVPYDCHGVVQLHAHHQLNGQRHHRDTVHLDVQVVLTRSLDGVVLQGHDLIDTRLTARFPDRLRDSIIRTPSARDQVDKARRATAPSVRSGWVRCSFAFARSTTFSSRSRVSCRKSHTQLRISARSSRL